MFDFLQTIFTKITSAVASVIIAVGLVSAPAPQPEPPPQAEAVVEVKQDAQELKNIKLEADLEQAKAETVKAKTEAKKAQREAEATKRKLAEENSRKQQEEQAEQQEEQRIQQELTQQNLLSCNGKDWSPCPAGQNFYCPATGDAQCLIENNQTSTTYQDPQIKIEVCKIEAQTSIKNFLEVGKMAIDEGFQICVQNRFTTLQQQLGWQEFRWQKELVDVARSSCKNSVQQGLDFLQSKADEKYNQQYLACLNK